MKIKKLLIPALFASVLCLGSCSCGGDGDSTTNNPTTGNNPTTSEPTPGTSVDNPSTSSPEHEFEYKWKKGTGVIFDEEQGYNTNNATVFEENGTRYVVYSGNLTKNTNDTCIAARSATKDANGNWVYSERHNILLPNADGWDQNIGDPSVIAGTFTYQGTSYKYLMAYGGNNNSEGRNNQIGLAVSNDVLGTWTKVGNEPFIKYDSNIYGYEYGAGAPSLVSYDKGGKAYLMYSWGETNLGNERVRDCDFSNLDAIIADNGARHIQVAGLQDKGDQTILSNVDFALKEDGTLFLARDVYPLSGNNPGRATSFEIAFADVTILNQFDEYSWTSIDVITGFDTMDEEDEESLGWDELYSAAFVTDQYGRISNDATEIEVIYSTFNEQEDALDTLYKYSAQLCSYKVSL